MSEFDAVIWIGTGVLTLAFFPITWFVLDYGLITPWRHRGGRRRAYEPWWTSGIGVMWFGLGVSMMLTSAIAIITRIVTQLHGGSNWPGREWLTLAVYTVVAAVILLTVFVYAIEKQTPGMVLISAPRRAREAARAEEAQLDRRALVHTGPIDVVPQ